MDLNAILDAAEQVGLSRLTSTAVAAQLGVSEGTVRRYASTADHLYALACARLVEQLDPQVDAGSGWKRYLVVLCDQVHDLVDAHPGIESYLVNGPYLASTMAHFDDLTDQIHRQAPALTRSTAWLLGARAVVLAASISGVRSTRYPPDVEPAGRRRALFDWTLEAFLTGAEVLIERGAVPQFETTSAQDWARL